MKNPWCWVILVVCLVSAAEFYLHFYPPLDLSPDLIHRCGLQIWRNECGGKHERLIAWNEGEEFASLGVGHFIWYPENKNGIFKESFPQLLAFFKSQGVQLPEWLEQMKGCPWQTKEEFQQAKQSWEQQQLRQFLLEHINLQILFMAQRLQNTLQILLKHTHPSQHSHLIFQFHRLSHTPQGFYALLDYLNFKGEGVMRQEEYHGCGWGLLQVLELLKGTEMGQLAVEEFVESAKKILILRVENSPVERGEQRWLKGWHNRLDTYSHFSL